MFQAIALRDDSTHDARHDLTKWLARCPTTLQNAVKSDPLRADWSRLVTVWYNGMRYWSEAGLLGYLRKYGQARAGKGGPKAMLKFNANALLDSARNVHLMGMAAWQRFSRK